MESSARGARIGARLQQNAERLATLHDRAHARVDEDGARHDSLLGGIVAPFLRELGTQLTHERPDPALPWTNNQGILRFSTARGREALEEELAGLRALLFEALASPPGEAEDLARTAFATLAFGVLHDGIYRERARLNGSADSRGSRFGGVVLELFERPVESAPKFAASPREAHVADATVAGEP